MAAGCGPLPTKGLAPRFSSPFRRLAWLEMAEEGPIVYIVDDDAGVREALDSLIRSVGFSVRTFASAHDFLSSKFSTAPGCLVLDVRLPGLSGLDLQRELSRAGVSIPIIFISGHGDIPMTVR